MIVSLPMYDWPETRDQVDRFWQRLAPLLQEFCTDVPVRLDRTDEHLQWQRNDLLLSQTCAYPLITSLPESTVVVGTPDYGCEFSKQGHYASPVLVHHSDKRQSLAEFAGSTLAYNSTDSQSGYNALKSLLVDQSLITERQPIFFPTSLSTGSHRGSIAAVAERKADVCAIDPVSWALAKRFDASADQLRVLTNTAFAPALPLISSPHAIPAHLTEQQWCNAIVNAFRSAIDSDAKQHLLLDGITLVQKSHYLTLPVSHLDMVAELQPG